MTSSRTQELSRRDLLRFTAAGAALTSASGWFDLLAAHAAKAPAKVKSCILLWMAGGPSQKDTFDMKPGTKDAGEFQPIPTSVPGIQISEHFPKFGKLMKHAAILRGMSTQESDHKLATYHLHTGYQNRGGVVAYPSLGALVARQLGKRDVPLPNFVTIGRAPQEAVGAGFLGPGYQPLGVSDPVRGLDFIEPVAPQKEFGRQVELWQQLEKPFQQAYKSEAADAHRFLESRQSTGKLILLPDARA